MLKLRADSGQPVPRVGHVTAALKVEIFYKIQNWDLGKGQTDPGWTCLGRPGGDTVGHTSREETFRWPGLCTPKEMGASVLRVPAGTWLLTWAVLLQNSASFVSSS